MKLAISKVFTAAAVVAACAMSAQAADLPRASPDDSRVRIIDYKPLGVTKIFVRRGVVTRIVLENDERIEVAVVGLSSECKSTTDEWCVVADPGTNQIFVRPRDAARLNNIEIRSSKRDYSIEFEVLTEPKVLVNGRRETEVLPAFYRVVFNYPKAVSPLAVAPAEPSIAASSPLAAQNNPNAQLLPNGLTPERSAALDKLVTVLNTPPVASPAQKIAAIKPPNERLGNVAIELKNSNYSKQVLPQGEDADPSAVFDDGRFTYFEFGGRREIPAIFAHGSDGEPSRVNWHMQDKYVVVHRLARRFTLRLGGAIAGVWNDSFDPVGIEIPTGTVSSEVERDIKSEKPANKPQGAARE